MRLHTVPRGRESETCSLNPNRGSAESDSETSAVQDKHYTPIHIKK